MCTASLISTGRDGLRLVFNRDELHTRAPAAPPAVHRAQDRRAIMPTDPEGGGTWIALNDGGLLLFLLNHNPCKAAYQRGAVSRGLIIPSLLHHTSARAALEAAAILNPARYSPFRLVLVDRKRLCQLLSDGQTLQTFADFGPHRPTMFTSSSLGDEVVDPPRRALFEQMVIPNPTPQAQDRFHAHAWPDRPEVSVNMYRRDARTVSITTVEFGRGRARMTYRPVLAPATPPVAVPA